MAEPVKVAQAYSSPTDCQTLAAVLQIDLICTDATIAAPKNATVAVNTACDRCDTVPLALHYVISADDPTWVPVCINQLIAAVNQELAAQQGDPALSLPDAEARVDGVIV